MIEHPEVIALISCLFGILLPIYLMFMHDWHLLSDATLIKHYGSRKNSDAYFAGELDTSKATLFKLRALSDLPDFSHRYLLLLMLVSVYGGVFYVLAALGFSGVLSEGMGTNSVLWTMNDYLIPVTSLATLSMVLFGYMMQADNCLFLRQEIQANLNNKHAINGEYAEEMQVNRTFRAISVGQIMPGIYMPMAVLQWALHGAWLFSVWDIVLRSIDDSLTPHVFFSATMRLALAEIMAVALFAIMQGMFNIYERDANEGNNHIINIRTGKAKWANYLVAAAIFAGFMPMQSMEVLTRQLAKELGYVSNESSKMPLYELKGMSSLHTERLNGLGILDVHQLAYIDTGIEVLARRSGIAEQQIRQWSNQAQLMLATGNDEKLQNELHLMGINTCSFLARVLHQQYIQTVQNNKTVAVWNNMTTDAQTLRFLATSALIYQDIYTQINQQKSANQTDIMKYYCTQIK
ncbi:MAG: DUF4332 domain-containing protein [Mariprofundales bacterium]